MEQLGPLSPLELKRSVERGFTMCRHISPINDDLFHFPFATMNIHRRYGFRSACEFALENATGKARFEDAAKWLSGLLKHEQEGKRIKRLTE